MWRSIWAAKSVILAGARWRLGKGEQIKVIGHPWLQDELNPFVTSDLQGLNNVTVNQLMTMDGRQWDKDIITDMFNYRDQQCIWNTLVNDSEEDDLLYWKEETVAKAKRGLGNK